MKEKTELEILLQIAQTQRDTVVLLQKIYLMLPGYPGRQAEPDGATISKQLHDYLDAAVKKFNSDAKAVWDELRTQDQKREERLGIFQKAVERVVGQQRHWEAAVANLQLEVVGLMGKNGQADRDALGLGKIGG